LQHDALNGVGVCDREDAGGEERRAPIVDGDLARHHQLPGPADVSLLSAIAKYERNTLRERTLAGLAVAKARGRVGGRPTKMTPDKAATAEEMRGKGRSIRDIAKTIEVSEATVVRHLARQRKRLQVADV
jgi:DNA invertase Pin-like site-specific DNA recombinase